MKWITAIGMALLIVYGSMIADVYAGSKGRHVTPYGDFCPRFTNYGKHKAMLSRENSRKALRDYYGAKGLGVYVEAFKGRFIKAVIVNKDAVIDKIIFDRRTGRIRSIH
jgi:hypothetical protein